MCGLLERVSTATEHSLKKPNTPLNLNPFCQNALDDCWEVGNLLEELEEQDHNMWYEGLSLITKLFIQSCLRNEQLGRVASSCHFAVDCLRAELFEY